MADALCPLKIGLGASSRQLPLDLLLRVPRVDRIHDGDYWHNSFRRIATGRLLRLPVPHAGVDTPLSLSDYCRVLGHANVTLDVPNVVFLRSMLRHHEELD